jgi:hypothetical protein
MAGLHAANLVHMCTGHCVNRWDERDGGGEEIGSNTTGVEPDAKTRSEDRRMIEEGHLKLKD